MFVGLVKRHFPQGMIMIIVMSQYKLLQLAVLWMWHTSYGNPTPAFHKYVEWWLVVGATAVR